jgi:glycosyltransferase XagB
MDLPSHLSARRSFYPWQILLTGFLVISWLLLLLYNDHLALAILSLLSTLLTLVVCVYIGTLVTLSVSRRTHDDTITASALAILDNDVLPLYTVLVPLYKEARILPKLIKSLRALDFPTDRLDIVLLLEEDDDETLVAAEKCQLPAHFRTLIIPPGYPRTKPRACNVGLASARGQFLVIYDAEDRPDPNQLKKALLAFSLSDDQVICIQCRLNFYNPRQNILTRLFTMEFSFWFDLFLPGLSAIGAPIPLGGTSNHFRVSALRAVGGWDAFNVAEDCDLGIRLASAGYQTVMLDSTTWEEANSQIGNWIRQRSRWIKGYLQTYLVHMRNPSTLFRNLGWKSFLTFQLTVGGTPLVLLLSPLFWLLIIGYGIAQVGILGEWVPWYLLPPTYALGFVAFVFGNLVFLYCSLCGAVIHKDYDLVNYIFWIPMYLALQGFAAWKGCYQLLTKPHHWEKTTHGLDN